MKRIVELKERNYADASTHADAPVNYEDAIETYKRIFLTPSIRSICAPTP